MIKFIQLPYRPTAPRAAAETPLSHSTFNHQPSTSEARIWLQEAAGILFVAAGLLGLLIML